MGTVFPVLLGTLIIGSKGYKKKAKSCLFSMLKFNGCFRALYKILSIVPSFPLPIMSTNYRKLFLVLLKYI